MNEFRGKSWRVMLPENWEGQHDEECETMYDPSGVGEVILYVDGVEQSRTNHVGDSNTVCDWHIGGYRTVAVSCFEGYLDDVNVYTGIVLNASEVVNLYQNTHPNNYQGVLRWTYEGGSTYRWW